jgi:Cys-tRNA(Pro)/Cys-tRNA(Cys) deacylase
MAAGTPAMVELDRAGIVYSTQEFDHPPRHDGPMRGFGLAAAEAIGVDPDRVFKTLLAQVSFGSGAPAGSTATVVGIVPVSAQLSLKELAAAVGGKRAEMCAPEAAERITGYVVGGISPFGQRKRLRTVIDETAELSDTIFVSGGRRGLDIELAPADLIAVLDAVVAPIASW